MAQPRALILRAPGTNCDIETAYAFELAGSLTESLHINRLLESPQRASEFQILCIPGGFSYGDDVAAGRILAGQIRHRLFDVLSEFKEAGKLILGICNGFQVLIKSGLLLAEQTPGQMRATLTWNDSRKYEARWVHVATQGEQSVFLKDIEQMYLPIAHAEGKFVPRCDTTLSQLEEAGQLVLRYADEKGGSDGQLEFPANPNGSIANVAGVCDETGRTLGLMPHPERFIDPTHHPRWTRGEGGTEGEGLQIFRNAVGYFA